MYSLALLAKTADLHPLSRVEVSLGGSRARNTTEYVDMSYMVLLGPMLILLLVQTADFQLTLC